MKWLLMLLTMWVWIFHICQKHACALALLPCLPAEHTCEVKCFIPVLPMVVGPPPCCSWHAIWLSCLKGGKRSELPGWLLLPARPNVLILSFCNPLVEVLCSKLMSHISPDQTTCWAVSLGVQWTLCVTPLYLPPGGKECFSSFSLLIKKKIQPPLWDTPCKPCFLQESSFPPSLSHSSHLFCELGQLT